MGEVDTVDLLMEMGKTEISARTQENLLQPCS